MSGLESPPVLFQPLVVGAEFYESGVGTQFNDLRVLFLVTSAEPPTLRGTTVLNACTAPAESSPRSVLKHEMKLNFLNPGSELNFMIPAFYFWLQVLNADAALFQCAERTYCAC